jgi:hypothetical protein
MTTSTSDESRDISCFVIGPIGDKDAPMGSKDRVAYEEGIQVLEEIIEPACVGFGITPLRADQIARPGEIPEQVFRAMRDAHLVIADLTGANANVMYELGLRHTTGKLTIQIGERERLPFDVASIRTILFRRTANGLVEARRQLSASVAAGLAHGGDPVAATRIWFENTLLAVTTDGAMSGDEKQPDPDEEPGFLEKLAAMSEGISSLLLSLDAMTTVLNEISRLTNESRAEVEAVNSSGGDPGARLFIANAHAKKLEQPAGRMEVLVGDYRQSVERIHPGMMYAIAEARRHIAEHDSQEESSRSFLRQLREFIAMTDETWPTLQAFRQVLIEGGEAARSVRRVNRRIAASLQQQADTAIYFSQWRDLLEDSGA